MTSIPDAFAALHAALEAFPLPERLYHVTRRENLGSIQAQGILRHHWGAVHGRCNVGPPEPCVYLSRHPDSNNLHMALFADGPEAVVVLEIDATALDLNRAYCDDFLYDAWMNERILADPEGLVAATGIDPAAAKVLFEHREACSDEALAEAMRPLARWYLYQEGEIAWPGDVPPYAILAVREYAPNREAEMARHHRNLAFRGIPVYFV